MKLHSLALLFLEWRSCLSSLSRSGGNRLRGEGVECGEGMEPGEAAGESEGVRERSDQDAPEYACWWLAVFIVTRDFSPGLFME